MTHHHHLGAQGGSGGWVVLCWAQATSGLLCGPASLEPRPTCPVPQTLVSGEGLTGWDGLPYAAFLPPMWIHCKIPGTSQSSLHPREGAAALNLMIQGLPGCPSPLKAASGGPAWSAGLGSSASSIQ